MADNIIVRFTGLPDINAAIERLKVQVDAATRSATKEAGDRLIADARNNFQGAHAPGYWHVGGNKPNRVSGELQLSILFLTPVTPEGRAKWMTRVGPTAIYGRVIELGATITPKEKKYLSWFDAQVGKRRFEKEVTIPPRPYFTPARVKLPPRMEEIFETAWRGALTIG